MEIDLYRDDGIVHVIVTGASHVEDALWISTYFGNCRYDGRHWRGFYAHETGIPSDFTNNVKGRSSREAWFATDKGVGVVADFPTDTYVNYTRDPKTLRGKATVTRGKRVLKTYDMEKSRAAQLRHRLGHRRQGRLGRHGQGPGLGDRRRVLRRGEEGSGKDDCSESKNGSFSMRVHAVFFAAILFAAVARAQTTPADPPPLPGLSPQMEEVLKAINALGPYQVPDLPLKTDQNYAHIPDRYRPFGQFGGVKPFKEHFREQIEYTGPGRSIPEPEDVKTVKIGFIGPIYPTVSVATGGKSHEETLGIKMAQGCQLAVDEANARGGYLKRKIPFELVVRNDNGLWGSSGNEIINMRYKDQCWAILGSVDGANSHIAIRVAPEGRDPDDEHGRYRSDLRRDQYPLDLPGHRR